VDSAFGRDSPKRLQNRKNHHAGIEHEAGQTNVAIMAAKAPGLIHRAMSPRWHGLSFLPSLVFTVQKPSSVTQLAENPVAGARGCCNMVVIAANGPATPPAGFDPRWPPPRMHTKAPPPHAKASRRAVGYRHNLNGDRRFPKPQRPFKSNRRIVGSVGPSFALSFASPFPPSVFLCRISILHFPYGSDERLFTKGSFRLSV